MGHCWHRGQMAGSWHVATAQESQREGTGGSEWQIARERVPKHELVFLGKVPPGW